MGYVKAATLADLAPGALQEVSLGGEYYVLCNVAGAVYAMSGICLHRGGPLGQGALHGTSVVCPWHAWEWDCRTGANDYRPDQCLPTYPVKIENGEILIDIP